MLRYASLLAPLLFGASRSPASQESLARLILAYMLVFFGIIFGLVALFIWAVESVGLMFGCAVMCILMVSAGALILMVRDRKTVASPGVPSNVEDDPLAKHIPDTLKDDPRIQQVLAKIGDNPVAATAGAVTVGMLLSRELIGD